MTSQRKIRLLAIDDEEGVLEMIRDHFGVRGYEVMTASDGGEGVEICAREKPDIILLDLKMKKMDGDEAIPHLKASSPETKIFVVSAYQDEAVAVRIKGLGVDAYFEKPVSIIELEKSVRKLFHPV